MTLIAVIDYDMGNLRSVAKALEYAGAQVTVTAEPATILKADKVVLPGVGAFGLCMENLKTRGLLPVVREVIDSGKWFLGICLGLQLLFEESEEFGPVEGLKILRGRVKKFPDGLEDADQGDLKIPHMGWNQVHQKRDSVLFKGLPDGAFFYFVHSYYVDPGLPSLVSGETQYGLPFCSAIEKNNILACQFHPEKSQEAGLKVLKNFVDL